MHVTPRFINCGCAPTLSLTLSVCLSFRFHRFSIASHHRLFLLRRECNYYADKLHPVSEFDCVCQLVSQGTRGSLNSREFERDPCIRIPRLREGSIVLYTRSGVYSFSNIRGNLKYSKDNLDIFECKLICRFTRWIRFQWK